VASATQWAVDNAHRFYGGLVQLEAEIFPREIEASTAGSALPDRTVAAAIAPTVAELHGAGQFEFGEQ
jgi:hypothetical protein